MVILAFKNGQVMQEKVQNKKEMAKDRFKQVEFKKDNHGTILISHKGQDLAIFSGN